MFDPAIWAQHGPFMLIIGALFALVVFFMRQHAEERREWRSSELEERRASREVTDRLSVAVDGLRDAIRNQARG